MRTASSVISCLVAALLGSCHTAADGAGGAGGAGGPGGPGGSGGSGGAGGSGGSGGSGRGLPVGAPWVAFYGSAQDIGDLAAVASRFRVIDIDADPGTGNFTREQIGVLRAGGKNRVLSYFNLGSCERFRSYWADVPQGLVSCKANTAAQRGGYEGYPDETWMDVGNAAYQELLIDYIAPRLVEQGVDGFFFDNLEIVEHGPATTNGPCDAGCAQGGLDLVRRLRERFPDLLFVMQNATGEVTRRGRTGGLDYPTLLDGISHEEVYAPMVDEGAQAQLLAWAALGMRPGGRTFWIATEDYVGDCSARGAARAIYERSRSHGFSPYATDSSAGQRVICYWPF
ncbi:MAG TPA: endo alpha-1,4 polygalactosaminidase [Kofleriaceae bacterium]|nr:endo alpha-1,4 polygalactosaminidase [Kofleriaceae bacterium]